ncbi:hypothetical protein ACLB2K_027975 [Fragaria x ananassa]
MRQPPLGPHLMSGPATAVGGGDVDGGRVVVIEKATQFSQSIFGGGTIALTEKDNIVLAVTENGDVVPRLPFSSFLFYATS